MAIAATHLTTSSSGTNATSYTTASITPTANALVLIAVGQEISGTPAVPAISGAGLTWVEIANCYFDQAGTQSRLTLFRALGASPTSGALTIDFSGVTQAGCEWSVAEFTGVDTSGTNGSGAIVQSAKTAEPGSAATSITATLGSAITAGDAAYSAAAWEANEAGSAEGTWTLLGQSTHAGPSAALLSQWRNASDDNSATTSWTTSALCGAIIVEIKAEAGAAKAPPPPRRVTGVWNQRRAW